MARYLGVRLDAHSGWKAIPELLGKIQVYTGSSGGWAKVKKVQVYTGHRWETVWEVGAVVHPPTVHTTTVTATRTTSTVSWRRPAGHILHQTVTLYASGAGAHGSFNGHGFSIAQHGHKAFTVSSSAHTATLHLSSGHIDRVRVAIRYTV